jgi:hypothetical protein
MRFAGANMESDQETQRRRRDRLADVISQIIRWSQRTGAKNEEKQEANRVIKRLIRIMNGTGEYWLLSDRDADLIEKAIAFHAVLARGTLPSKIETMRRRAYRGGLVSSTPISPARAHSYQTALGTDKPTPGNPADIARVERVAHVVRELRFEGVALWRQPKQAAARFKKVGPLPSRVLTDEARERLASAYLNGRQRGAISHKDFIKCVETAIKIEPLL